MRTDREIAADFLKVGMAHVSNYQLGPSDLPDLTEYTKRLDKMEAEIEKADSETPLSDLLEVAQDHACVILEKAKLI